MDSYQSLQKQNTGIAVAALSLVVAVALSATLLFSRLTGFAPADTQHYIPLTRSGGITTVREGQRQDDGSVTFRHSGYHPDNHRLLAVNPGFRVYDNNTVWDSTTDVEIFRISYDNGTGQIIVRSSDGEKVIAPGTENTYQFTLENTGKTNLEYSMEMEAWFGEEGEEDPITIPVLARVKDYNGNYLAGSSDSMEDVLELNNVSQEGTLARKHVAPYTLEWEWPFEGDDSHDTLLGNLAVDEDITLTIRIHVVSTYIPTPGADCGIPKTGDTSGIQLAFTIMVGSLACLMLLPVLSRRKRRETDDKK